MSLESPEDSAAPSAPFAGAASPPPSPNLQPPGGKPVWVRPPAWKPGDMVPGPAMVRCAYSGVEKFEADMLRMGDHWIAPEHKDAAVEYLQQGGEFKAHEKQVAPPPHLLSVLGHGWSLVARNWPLLLAIHACIEIPCCLFGAYVEHLGEMALSTSGRYTMLGYMSGLLSIVGTAATIRVFSVSWSGQTPGFHDAMLKALSRWGAMFLVYFLTVFLFTLGLILLVIPGLVVLIRTSFADFYVVENEEGGTEALSSSMALAKGSFWRIAGFGLFATVVFLLIYVPLGMGLEGLEFLPESLRRWEFAGMVEWVASLPVIWVFASYFVLYKALRAEKDPPVRSWRA